MGSDFYGNNRIAGTTKYTYLLIRQAKNAIEDLKKTRGVEHPSLSEITRQINLTDRTRKVTERQVQNALEQDHYIVGMNEAVARTSPESDPAHMAILQDLKDKFERMRTDARLPKQAQIIIAALHEEALNDGSLDNLLVNETVRKIMLNHGVTLTTQEAGMYMDFIRRNLIKDSYHADDRAKKARRPRLQSTYEVRSTEEKNQLEDDILSSLLQ